MAAFKAALAGAGSGAARGLVLLALVVSLAACTARMRNYGYTPTDSDLAALQVGVDTRETVIEAVGSPAGYGVLRESGIYYLSAKTRTWGPREPEFVDRQLVAISFDPAGRVSNIERFTLRDGNVVALSRRVTDSNVRGVSFLRQLLGNLGRFRAENFLD
ncbi:outer membrane protein assembly factor BamE domain-containing protein [Vannielia litorea]|uniref:outer membrane protein assembly factor BamE domain-containing protein n=1 Tax=Vannielia litorea TaxID=1217970 RepID=UPI001BD08DE8|nr:outer membrane protein assembly factor BamE [Vannielia litorea]MBS8225238.1 outer membrane protein assembly factor BamE [Vannielia litorea]